MICYNSKHMHYSHKDGARKIRGKGRSRLLFSGLGILLLLGGGYVLFNVLSPMLPIPGEDIEATAKKLVREQPKPTDNRLYIPKINVDIAIVLANGDEMKALENGALHRVPQNGNPKDGGNFVLAAHRFTIGLTPSETRKKSPLYHIDALENGDMIYVDYEGVRYAYKIVKHQRVPASAVEIERRTENNQMTLYSCDLNGPKYAREVLFAEPVGTVAWSGDKPVLQ